MPDPAPWSSNCDVVTIWNGNTMSNNNGVSPEINNNSMVTTASVNSSADMVMPQNAIPEMNIEPSMAFGDEKSESFDSSFVIPSDVSLKEESSSVDTSASVSSTESKLVDVVDSSSATLSSISSSAPLTTSPEPVVPQQVVSNVGVETNAVAGQGIPEMVPLGDSNESSSIPSLSLDDVTS